MLFDQIRLWRRAAHFFCYTRKKQQSHTMLRWAVEDCLIFSWNLENMEYLQIYLSNQ